MGEEERGGVLEKVEEVKKWIAEKEEEQSKLAGSDDPVFTSEECPGQTKSIESMVSRLSRKPKPKPVVEETSDSDSGSNETQSEEGSKTDEEEPSSEDATEEKVSEEPAEESTEEEAKE